MTPAKRGLTEACVGSPLRARSLRNEGRARGALEILCPQQLPTPVVQLHLRPLRTRATLCQAGSTHTPDNATCTTAAKQRAQQFALAIERPSLPGSRNSCARLDCHIVPGAASIEPGRRASIALAAAQSNALCADPPKARANQIGIVASKPPRNQSNATWLHKRAQLKPKRFIA